MEQEAGHKNAVAAADAGGSGDGLCSCLDTLTILQEFLS